MGPQLPLLVAALAGCLLPARGCVTCDAKVVEALYHFEMEYLPSRSQELQGVLDRIKYLLNDFKKIPDLNDQHLGVVGEGREERGNPESWERRGLVWG